MTPSPPPPAHSTIDQSIRHGRLAGAERHIVAPDGVVCPGRRAAILRALAGAALLASVGALLLYGALSTSVGLSAGLVLGLISLLLFGAAFVLVLPRVFGPPVGILLLPEGIFCRMPVGTAWVPWDTVDAVRIVTIQKQKSVCFSLGRDAGAPVLTGPARWFRWASRIFFRFDFGFAGQALVQPPEDVLALLVRLLGDRGLRAQLRDPSILATLRRPDASAWRRW